MRDLPSLASLLLLLHTKPYSAASTIRLTHLDHSNLHRLWRFYSVPSPVGSLATCAGLDRPLVCGQLCQAVVGGIGGDEEGAQEIAVEGVWPAWEEMLGPWRRTEERKREAKNLRGRRKRELEQDWEDRQGS